MSKHYNKEKTKTEIIIREKTEPEHGDYYDVNENTAETSEKNDIKPKKRKYFIRVIILLIIAVIALVFWFNKDNFSSDNIYNWFQTKLMGTGVGDGYPVTVTGTSVKINNFFADDGNVVSLSDTALTALNSTGKEIFSFRHSYNNPTVSYKNGRYLVYNIGGKGYSVISAESGSKNFTTESKISLGIMSENGTYAVIEQPSDYASELKVYTKDGTNKYIYQFADGYVTAGTMNSDGSMGAFSTVFSQNGELKSKIYILDFSKEDATPICEYTSERNIITGLYWNNNTIYGVGDISAIAFDTKGNSYEYSYDGKQVTASATENGYAFISISSYSHSGASTLLIFSGIKEPDIIESKERIIDISSKGNVVSILSDKSISAYYISNLALAGTANAGYDAKALALANESSVYILGVREIRLSPLVKN